jgi:cytochrome c-type biogenesis protein CcmH
VDFMVSRYGDFVLYRPPFKATTLLLWIGPLALVLVGFWTLARVLRARRQAQAPPLTAEERERAERLLAAKEEP